jgi:hypothetical protein
VGRAARLSAEQSSLSCPSSTKFISSIPNPSSAPGYSEEPESAPTGTAASIRPSGAVSKALTPSGGEKICRNNSRVKFAPLALHVCHNQGSVHVFGQEMFAVATPDQIPIMTLLVETWQRPQLGAESRLHPPRCKECRLFPHSRRRLVFWDNRPAD